MHFFSKALTRNSVTGRLTRGLALVVLLEVIAVGLRYLLQVVVARLAGPEGYGTYTFALTWAQTLAIPAGLGLSGVVIRYVPTYLARRDWSRLAGLLTRARLLTVGTGVLIGAVAALLTLVLGTAGAEPGAMFLAFAAIPLLALSTLQAESLRGGGHLFAARVIPTVFQPLLVLGASLAAAAIAGGLSGTAALWCLVVATLVGAVIQQVAMRRSFARSRKSPPAYETREWLGVGRHLLAVKLFQLVLNTSDILIVGALLGVVSAGLYAAATKTAALAGLVAQAVNLAVPPSIARAHAEGDSVSIERQLRWSAKISSAPSLCLAAGLVLFGDEVLSAFGSAFVAATTALTVLALARLFTAWTGPVGSVLNVTGHQRINVRVYGVAAALQVGLDLLLIPIYGITGAALASAVAMIFWNMTLYVLVMRVVPVRLWPIPLRRDN